MKKNTTANSIRLCSESIDHPKPAQKTREHLITPEEAIKLLHDELEWAEENMKKKMVNCNEIIKIISKFRLLVSGSRKRMISKPKSHEVIPMIQKPSEYRSRLLLNGDGVGQCAYCGCRLTQKNSTIDHVHPISKGGKNTPTNMILACEHCNHTKGSRTPSEWANDILSVDN